MGEFPNKVLILILLEVGLLVSRVRLVQRLKLCLNPYSTGSWVAGAKISLIVRHSFSLNPYSTGSWVAGDISLT